VLAPAAFTLLGDLLPAKERGRAMGLNGALIALAAMVAPALSGVLRDRFGFEGVFLAVGGVLLATCVAAQLLIADTYRPEPSERASARVYAALFRRPGLSLAFLAAAALTFGLGTLVTHLPIHLSDLGYGGAQTGLAFSSFALVAMFVMAAPMARSGGAWGRLGPLGWGLLAIGVALLLLPLRAEMAAIAVFMAVYGLGFGLVFPAANALVADCTEPRHGLRPFLRVLLHRRHRRRDDRWLPCRRRRRAQPVPRGGDSGTARRGRAALRSVSTRAAGRHRLAAACWATAASARRPSATSQPAGRLWRRRSSSKRSYPVRKPP
jgi:MFS family permease